jgi:teichuronic acid biosynthesis glycosyltransferase TuaC
MRRHSRDTGGQLDHVADVVWLTPGYPWDEQPVTGVFYQTQVRALKRLGVPVTVLSPTPWTPWPASRLSPRWSHYANAPRIADDQGVAVARPRYLNIPGQPSWSLPDRMIAHAAWRDRRDWTGAKLVHGHSMIEALAAWRLARRARLPLVLTFHGSDINTWPDHFPDRVPDLRAAVRDAGAVIAVSAALAERVRSVTGVRAVHLPLGCDHQSIAESVVTRVEARRSLQLPDGQIVVLFVGHLLRAKGVRELTEAILSLGDPFLGVFVGTGPELGYAGTKPGRSTQLMYTGEQEHADVVRYMCAADVLVLPSYSEGLPTVLVEAGSVGVPVIASSVGGIPELLAGDRGTIIQPRSAEAITAALKSFVSDRNRSEAQANRLRTHVYEDYDVNVNAAKLLECYRSIAPDLAVGQSRRSVGGSAD